MGEFARKKGKRRERGPLVETLAVGEAGGGWVVEGTGDLIGEGGGG